MPPPRTELDPAEKLPSRIGSRTTLLRFRIRPSMRLSRTLMRCTVFRYDSLRSPKWTDFFAIVRWFGRGMSRVLSRLLEVISLD